MSDIGDPDHLQQSSNIASINRKTLFQSLEKLKECLPVDGSYITTLLKMIGITYIGQFSSGICKDAGYASTGAQIDLFCRLSVMVLSMPVLLALLDTIQGFLV